MANKEVSSSLEGQNSQNDATDKPRLGAFSIAQALSVVREKREHEERVRLEREQALEEQKKEKAKEKRRRRRKNLKDKKAKLKVEASPAKQIDMSDTVA